MSRVNRSVTNTTIFGTVIHNLSKLRSFLWHMLQSDGEVSKLMSSEEFVANDGVFSNIFLIV